MTCCAAGFAISGYGSQYLFTLMEQGVFANMDKFSDTENIKEICKAFIFSMRGSRLLHQAMMPRIQATLSQFTCNELCYLLHGYHKQGNLPKSFTSQIEEGVVKFLRNTKEISIEEIALITKVFCTTRTGSREFHKLLETTILSRLDDLKKDMKILY